MRGQVDHCSIGRGCGWQWAVVKRRFDLDLVVHRCGGYVDFIKIAMSHDESKANNPLGLDGVLYFVTRGLVYTDASKNY